MKKVILAGVLMVLSNSIYAMDTHLDMPIERRDLSPTSMQPVETKNIGSLLVSQINVDSIIRDAVTDVIGDRLPSDTETLIDTAIRVAARGVKREVEREVEREHVAQMRQVEAEINLKENTHKHKLVDLESRVQQLQKQVIDLSLLNNIMLVMRKGNLHDMAYIIDDAASIATEIDIFTKRSKVASIFATVEPFKRFLNKTHVFTIKDYLENTLIPRVKQIPLLHIMNASIHFGEFFDVLGDVRDFTRANGFGYGLPRQAWMKEYIDYFPHSSAPAILAAFDAENQRRMVENERIKNENFKSKEQHELSIKSAIFYDKHHYPLKILTQVIQDYNKLASLYNEGIDDICTD